MIAVCNMEMPRNCIECGLGDAICCPVRKNFMRLDEQVTIELDSPPSNCPLKPVEVLRGVQVFRESEVQKFGRDLLEDYAHKGINRKMVDALEKTERIKYSERENIDCSFEKGTIIEGRLYTVVV